MFIERFQSLAGSPSTSHSTAAERQAAEESFNPWREAPPRATESNCALVPPTAMCFNPWREAPPRATQAVPRAALACRVSIPGGKPLHEPLPLGFYLLNETSGFQSLAGSPSTSHCPLPCTRFFPRAEFQSQAGSPSTSHRVMGLGHAKKQ